MDIAYIIVTTLAAAANLSFAALDLARHQMVINNMTRLEIPASWRTMLGVLKAAGALGLLIGIVVPPIGIAAAVGLVLFFIGAVLTHLRVGDYALAPAVTFLALAVAALALRLAAAGVAFAPESF